MANPHTLGIPYAAAAVDDRGYFLTCPRCDAECRPAPTLTDEDDITKSAGGAYAIHHAAEHGLEDALEAARITGAQEASAACEAAGFMLALINEDLANDLADVADRITGFVDLHDYVDANEYVLAAEAALGLTLDPMADNGDGYAVANLAVAIVGARLAQAHARRALGQ